MVKFAEIYQKLSKVAKTWQKLLKVANTFAKNREQFLWMPKDGKTLRKMAKVNNN